MAAHYQIEGGTAAEISASVETGVRVGALPAGAALPPVRALAGQLAVSPATVAKAYQALRQRGLVETAGRNGTRIRPRPPVAASRSAFRLPPAAGALDLSTGEPDHRLLPDFGPHLAALAHAGGTPIGYGDAGVLPELVDLAGRRLAADGVPADSITVTSGALDGIERLLTAHLRPGDPVGVEDPGWANLLDLVAALGFQPVGVRAALAVGVRALVVTSRAQNPTGAAVTADRATILRELLGAHHDLLLIEDDHAAELAPMPLHSLAAVTRSWAFVRSASKPYGPDLRLAVLAGDEATVARVAGRMRVGAGWVSTMLQRLAVRLWQDPEVAAQVAAAGGSYQRRRDALRAALARRGLTAHGRSGINVWLPVPDEIRAVTGLRDAGYAVAPGSLYRLGTGPAVRITISPLADADIEPLADVLLRVTGTGAPTPFGA